MVGVMADLGQPYKLTCDCNSELFVQVVKLQSGKQGTVPVPFGWRCEACNAVVDIAYLQKKQTLAAKRREMQQLAEEIGTPETNMTFKAVQSQPNRM